MRYRAAAGGLAMLIGLAGMGLAGIDLAGAGAAEVQPAPNTVLHLSVTGSVPTAPDQLVADMVAQGTSSSAAEAQRRVNALMAEGMRTAQDSSGITARALGYAVTPADDKRSGWTAQQTLELRGADGPALLGLVGRLQEKGFVTAALGWQVSSELRRKAQAEATTIALQELRKQAASAAATLGLNVDHLQDVRLNGPVFQPRMPMQAMAARPPPPPQATAAAEEITAEVSADVALRP